MINLKYLVSIYGVPTKHTASVLNVIGETK